MPDAAQPVKGVHEILSGPPARPPPGPNIGGKQDRGAGEPEETEERAATLSHPGSLDASSRPTGASTPVHRPADRERDNRGEPGRHISRQINPRTRIQIHPGQPGDP